MPKKRPIVDIPDIWNVKNKIRQISSTKQYVVDIEIEGTLGGTLINDIEAKSKKEAAQLAKKRVNDSINRPGYALEDAIIDGIHDAMQRYGLGGSMHFNFTYIAEPTEDNVMED